MKQSSIACIGECMLELSQRPDGSTGLSFGGDTLNTAVYLSRLGGSVSYVTALGDDPWSDEMLAVWELEGIDVTHVLRVPGRLPGLYAIRTDDRGERSFYYWRDQSPVRDLFRLSGGPDLFQAVIHADYWYLSGITLSLFNESDREVLFSVIDQYRKQGGRVAFDSNHRPNRWPSDSNARENYERILRLTDIALPTLDDEQQLFGDKNPMVCAQRHHDLGVAEVMIKTGDSGCFYSSADQQFSVPLPEVRQPVDTTGAGDSFNGAWLAARFRGLAPDASAMAAHKLAGEVIMHPGAIIPREAIPEVGI